MKSIRCTRSWLCTGCNKNIQPGEKMINDCGLIYHEQCHKKYVELQFENEISMALNALKKQPARVYIREGRPDAHACYY